LFPTQSIQWFNKLLPSHQSITLADQAPEGAQPQSPSQGAPGGDEPFFTTIFGSDSSDLQKHEPWYLRIGRIVVRLLLAALLSATLAFRPRRAIHAIQRNPYVSQTEILIAVVASALMMIVADNAARAFGIFAAASLVRFRTNIRDPKETTVLLVNLGVGLATGVGRWELAIVFSLIVLVLLWILESYEPAQVVRTMELKVKTRDVETTDETLKEIFEKRHLTAELREINKEDDKDPLGKIVYYVGLNPQVSVDRISDEIFSMDPDNIDSIEWDQKRSTSYIYR
jgi:uncharacterized membrane protein YhiD involved in acid resistance